MENKYQRPQNKPTIPSRNHQNVHFPPRREHTNVHIPVEQTPPRRTEVPLSTENLYYDSVNTGKKPQRNPPSRWPRPTSRPRQPIRIAGRPHVRPPPRIERPVNTNRPGPLLTQGLPNVHYQNEFNKYSQYPSTVTPIINSNQQMYSSGSNSDQVKLFFLCQIRYFSFYILFITFSSSYKTNHNSKITIPTHKIRGKIQYSQITSILQKNIILMSSLEIKL